VPTARDLLVHEPLDVVQDSVQPGPLSRIVADAPAPGDEVVLVIETRPDASGPDQVVLGCEGVESAALDGRYLATEVAGGFVGRMVGVYATGGTGHVDWLSYGELT
jgi:xylan 1,4-beta-xylosidase